MATRCNIVIKNIKDSDDDIICIYKQFDGYFSYIGKLLQKMNDTYINDMFCFAEQLIHHLKEDMNIFHLTSSISEYYSYILYENDEHTINIIASNSFFIWEGKLSEFNTTIEDIYFDEYLKTNPENLHTLNKALNKEFFNKFVKKYEFGRNLRLVK